MREIKQIEDIDTSTIEGRLAVSLLKYVLGCSPFDRYEGTYGRGYTIATFLKKSESVQPKEVKELPKSRKEKVTNDSNTGKENIPEPRPAQ